MHCAAIVANVPRKKHLRALRRDYCTIVAEKCCAHCIEIIVQYGREKVVRIVPRAEKIFPTYFSISLQDFLTINRFARHCLCCFISKQRGNPVPSLLKGWVEGPDHVTKQVLPSRFDFGQLGPKPCVLAVRS